MKYPGGSQSYNLFGAVSHFRDEGDSHARNHPKVLSELEEALRRRQVTLPETDWAQKLFQRDAGALLSCIQNLLQREWPKLPGQLIPTLNCAEY